jgi:6-phosphogluconolactonase
MRMKFNKSGQLLLVSAASLAAAGMITACGSTLTVDFVYVTSSKAAGANNYGEIDVFEVNSESGLLRQIPTSPFPSGGRDPVAEAVASNFANLYVVDEDDNTVVQFAIGNDGKLYPQNTVNTPGVFPMGVAVNGSHMYVADTYQPLPTCSPAEPCSGSVASFPLSSSGQPGTPVGNPAGDINYWPLTLTCSPADVLAPSAIEVVGSGKYVFVAAVDTTAAADNTALPVVSNPCDVAGAGTAPTGYVFAFAANSDGTLSAVAGSPFTVAAKGSNGAGVQPSAIASDPAGKYVYVTDFLGADQGQTGARNVYGYSIANGVLSQLDGSPFEGGNQPSSLVVDPTGGYAYVANSLDNTITAYTIGGGALSTFGSFAVSTQPAAVLVDPSTGHFVYAAGYLGSSVSGYQLIPGGTPTLVPTQRTPYTSNAQPTAMAAIPHGGMAAK